MLAGQTERIALGVASVVLPLRHPAHVAKAAASADVLSGGRLILGVASGDRPDEYPALNLPFEDRGARFRESFDYIRHISEVAPEFENAYGQPGRGMDMLPKPTGGRLPLLITGGHPIGDTHRFRKIIDNTSTPVDGASDPATTDCPLGT